MLITSETLNMLTTAYQTSFQKGLKAASPRALEIAMKTKSTSGETIYPWLGQFPQLREWIGDRQITQLKAFGWLIKNRLFESTVIVPRIAIEDDQYGLFAPLFEQMGDTTALHPDRLLFELIQMGFQSKCYDGQNFFDAEHPLKMDNAGDEVLVSNMQPGVGPAWFLIDASKPIRSFVWQERLPYEFQTINTHNSERVVLKDEYLYGVRGRVNAGYGLWQLAFGSKAALDWANYAAARHSMQSLRGDTGGLLGITPTHLIVGPSLEQAALELLKAALVENGRSNIWMDSAKLIVSPFLD
ncbi:Mu-like prophage major head subunit gpT family protein [Methylosinus sp. KRF6]|uniref:Mu-like prophage major head subunit gpT family protein n=1 Tax=Methylosinus sp. KRF6 TaxID=2846853 RepID=UPI001C0D9DA2|nr:Mu-like prophage major head subunit gpT family protein [Methylosinus sp. KRF6]MBU3889853.1 Mu-like prophage major head subunit gpT family protein [Methylosinus sp. KRF6]